MSRDEVGSALLLLVAALALSGSKKGTVMRINTHTGRPIVVPGTHALTRDELVALITATGFADQAKALAIAKRESGGFADVVTDTRGMTSAELASYWNKPAQEELSVGLWQINALVHFGRVPGATSPDDAVERLKDPAINAHVAFVLSNGGTNWAPWGG